VEPEPVKLLVAHKSALDWAERAQRVRVEQERLDTILLRWKLACQGLLPPDEPGRVQLLTRGRPPPPVPLGSWSRYPRRRLAVSLDELLELVPKRERARIVNTRLEDRLAMRPVLDCLTRLTGDT
jgi:hypothetical protein